MKRIIVVIHIFIIITLSAGCLFDSDDNSDDKELKDRGSYTLEAIITERIEEVYPQYDEIVSYPGGGGLFILIMKPGEDFEGRVRLSVSADSLLNAFLTRDYLSLENCVAELAIRPDSSMDFGTDSLEVVSIHAGIADTLNLIVEIRSFNQKTILLVAVPCQSLFVSWLEMNYPELGIEAGQDWFIYNKFPMVVGGGAIYAYLNETWEMSIIDESRNVFTPTIMYLILRPRGELRPTFAAKKEEDGTIHEIPFENLDRSLYKK